MGTRSRNHVLLAVLVVVSAVLLSAGSAYALPRKLADTSDLMEQLCSKTEKAALCLGSVTGFIKGKASVLSVLQAEIDASSKETKSALAQAAKLYKSASTGEKQVLEVCKENYVFAVHSLARAKEAIAARDISTLNTVLSAAITYAGTCDDAYDESTYKSPLAKVDQLLMDLGGNCLGIAQQINW